MQRRDFLIIGAAAATAAQSTSIFAAGLNTTQMAALDAPGVQAALVIGREVLRQGVIPADAELLFAGFGLTSHRGPVSLYHQLAPSIPARTAQDFEAGKTVSVSGWVFSRTEAQFYALIAFVADEATS